MKQEKNKNYAVCLCDMDFIDGADNVYRTDEYIVKQQISFLESDVGTSMVLSDDTYYLRTPQRDAEYEFAFQGRANINGKRLKSASYTRKYVD